MKNYLGIDPYHVTIDPQGQYIAHVDCWGKFLAPDKILLARVPETHVQYDKYEEVADYFKTTNCSWGYPYKVYRVELPGGNAICPYTNSLILNKKVLVPMGSNAEYNEAALQVYRDAMPGYEIIGIDNADPYDWSWDGWLNTDALHCRTRGVMDFDMLYVDHREVLFGEQEWHDSLAIVSKVIAYSGADLKQDSLLVYYSIDGGEYQTAKMKATGMEDEYVAYIKGYEAGSEVKYYVYAADESGRNRQQPIFGKLDPHSFTIKNSVGITENDINNVEIYPNPAKDIININGSDIMKVEIYNSVGQLIISTEHKNEIDVSMLNCGLYLVRITDEKGNHHIKKMVKDLKTQ